MDLDFTNRSRAWTDVNRIPELAEPRAGEIRDDAVLAALQVLQTMGPDALELVTVLRPKSRSTTR